MKERPILFSGTMVRAIIEGHKTMTRRVVKPQPDGPGPSHAAFLQECGLWVFGNNSGRLVRCPYGQPGDRLWVRETFRLPSRHDDATPEELAAQVSRTEIRYLADGDVDLNGKTRPGIFLRYGWHRILLEVVSVRVERVQDITCADAEAEGMSSNPMRLFHEGIMPRSIDFRIPMPIQRFIGTWNAINYKRGYGWDANPWVWVVEFKRVKP